MERSCDFLAFSSRNYIVNNERVYFSANVTKFSDGGFRYETALIVTDQAIYNYYHNLIKRRTPLNLVEALTLSTKSSEMVIHIVQESDYRLQMQELRNDLIETLLVILCTVKHYVKELKIYEIDLLNLNAVTTDRARAALKKGLLPKEEFARFWNPQSWKTRERESLDRRQALRRRTTLVFARPQVVQKTDICLDDFELLKVLGKGAFGKVVLAQKKDTGKYYAIKILKKAQIISENMFQKTLAEKTILQSNRHPFLVGLEYAFQTETKLYFVLEFMMGGELFSHLRREGRFPEARAKFYAVCIILGLGFLHDSNYIYRDLKLENILLDEKGYAVITDFGFAKFLAHDEKTRTFCGTPDYVAPEILENKGHDRMVDWWSLGVLVYEMIYGQTPFYSPNRDIMYQNIRTQEARFSTLVPVSDVCKDLIFRLLRKDPVTRLGQLGDHKEILAHPWFSDINIQQVLERRYQAPFLPDISSLEKNFEQAYLNENVRQTIENGTDVLERSRIIGYEKDFELLNFNKDSINK